jgi:hypothetical protein
LKPSTPEEIYQQAVIDWLASDVKHFKHPPDAIQIAYAEGQTRRRESALDSRFERGAASRKRSIALAKSEWGRWVCEVSRDPDENGGAYSGAGPPIELGGTLDAIAEELEGVPGCADALIAAAFALEEVPLWP